MKTKNTGNQNSFIDNWSVAVAIMGARMHYAVPSVLAHYGRLERFYTDFYLGHNGLQSFFQRNLANSKIKVFRRIGSRHDEKLPGSLVYSFPLIGLLYSTALSVSTGEENREKIYLLFGKIFNRLSNQKGFGNASIAFGMNTASFEWFTNAKNKGLYCVLEQCIAPFSIYQNLISDEYQLWNNWEHKKIINHEHSIMEREIKEWDLANLIICGSEFVVDGLQMCGIERQKCITVPYAVDVKQYRQKSLKENNKNRPINVLFLGSVGLRKGIQYLNLALSNIDTKYVNVKAAGGVALLTHAVAAIQKNMEVLGLIPRSEIPELLAWADVLVLPSICEGSALVTYEALASGVPVITTPNAGSPVIDGETGYIVPIRDSLAIAEKLERLAAAPELLKDMSAAARRYAEEHLSYEAYSKRLISAFEQVLRRNDD